MYDGGGFGHGSTTIDAVHGVDFRTTVAMIDILELDVIGGGGTRRNRDPVLRMHPRCGKIPRGLFGAGS